MNDLRLSIADALDRGLSFLRKEQLRDGSFASFSSPSPDLKNVELHHSAFPAYLILLCLSDFEENAKIKFIRKKAIKYLLSQRSSLWSFNYWSRGSEESKNIPFPDDLDDTFCALSALFQYDSKIVDGDVMGKCVTLLTALEKKEGGPYRTWIVPSTAEKRWKDVDIAVNANIGYFLALCKIQLPALEYFVETKIKENDFFSEYYFESLPVIYFISRFYKGKYKEKLLKQLLSKRGDKFGNNPLECALAVSAYINLGGKTSFIEDDIRYLISARRRGGWKIDPLIVEVLKDKGKLFSGAAALTTAFCLEALHKYFSVYKNGQEEKSVQKTKEITEIYSTIIKRSKKIFSRLEKNLQKKTLDIMEKTLDNDSKKQISLLPYYIKKALGEKGEEVPSEVVIGLGTANLLGWVAYTIYDNFLDEEGTPTALPVANIISRELALSSYELLSGNKDFKEVFRSVMDNIDGANLWEAARCRTKIKNGRIKNLKLPDWKNYEKLSQRSFGHALGPIGILMSLGYGKDSTELKKLSGYFHHYLIAKQLNDDAHDWEEDIKRGHLSPVVCMLLKKYGRKEFFISEALAGLNKIFWLEIVPDISNLINFHTGKADKYLKSLSLISDPSIFEKLLYSLKKAAENALSEKDESLKFLKAFNK